MLKGKQNCCMDHLIYSLVRKVIPYYRAKHHCKKFGFEGPDLECSQRMEIITQAEKIFIEHIEEVIQSESYLVKSQSHLSMKYHINIIAYTCECASYPLILFCTYICAVQFHFPKDTPTSYPIFSLFV